MAWSVCRLLLVPCLGVNRDCLLAWFCLRLVFVASVWKSRVYGHMHWLRSLRSPFGFCLQSVSM
jgi:hypothetical protein